MGLPNRYQIDSTVTVAALFTAAATGQPIDPSTIILYIMPPNGVIATKTYGVDPIVRDGIGSYHFDVDANASGNWLYKWQGEGAVVVTSPDTRFTIDPSELIPG